MLRPQSKTGTIKEHCDRMVDNGQVLERRKTFLNAEPHGLTTLLWCFTGGKMRGEGGGGGGRSEPWITLRRAMVLCVSLFVCLFLRLKVYFVLLCCHARCCPVPVPVRLLVL